MDSLVKSLAALVTPENTARLAKFLGTDAGRAGQAVKILTALAVASMARKSATPAGAATALGSLPQDEAPGLVASVFSALKGKAPEETPADQMKAMFGSGVNSMVSALSQRLGFDMAPLAGILTPLMGQHLAKSAHEQGLDPAGFARMLKQGQEDFLKDLANAETAGIVGETLATGDQAEILRSRFTEQELEDIHLAPMAAYWLVAQASLSGIRGSIQELKAANRVSIELQKTVPPVSLLGLVFGGGSLTSAEEEELMEDTRSEDDLLANIRAGTAVVKAKAPEELDTFRKLVTEVARNVAEASKEGGFLGIGSTRVTEKEKVAIGRVESALLG